MQICNGLCSIRPYDGTPNEIVFKKNSANGAVNANGGAYCAICTKYIKVEKLVKGYCPCCKSKARLHTRNFSKDERKYI
jgi:hypothetical protein